MKIFDCFTFYNEFDLLELRLKEHWDSVDYFVISEANLTFQGNKKPFFLYDNWDRFKDYHEKIIHIKVEDMPSEDPNPWIREIFQRNSLIRGLDIANPEDIIAVSDCDEILRKSTWKTIREEQDYKFWGSYSYTFNFKLNYMMTQQLSPHFYFIFNMATRAKEKIMPMNLRMKRDEIMQQGASIEDCIIHHGGWHFSYLGDTDYVANKLRSYSHTEYSYIAEFVDVDVSISQRKGINPHDQEIHTPVQINDYYPETVLNEIDKWEKHIYRPREYKDFPTIVSNFNFIK